MKRYNTSSNKSPIIFLLIITIISIAFAYFGMNRGKSNNDHKIEQKTTEINRIAKKLKINSSTWTEYYVQPKFGEVNVDFQNEILVKRYENNSWSEARLWKKDHKFPFNSSTKTKWLSFKTTSGETEIVVSQIK